MKLLLTPWRTIQPKSWHWVIFIVIIAQVLVITNVSAVDSRIFNNLGDFFTIVKSALFGIGSEPPNTSGIVVSIAGDIFGQFFKGLDAWAFKNNGGMYKQLADALLPIFLGLINIIIILILFSLLLGKFTDKALKLGKFMIFCFFAILLLESPALFQNWFYEPLLELLAGLILILLKVETIVGVDIATAIFGGIENVFSKIFTEIEEISQSVGVTEGKKMFALLSLILAFGGLYFIFSMLIFVGFFGFFVMIGSFPIILTFSIVNRQVLFAWLKTTLNYFLIPLYTAIVMSITLLFLDDALRALITFNINIGIFSKELGLALFVAILSIGLHWKAPEFAAGISGGMASGAGSVVGATAAVGAGALAATKGAVAGGANITSGFRGGNLGNKNSMLYQMSQEGRERLLKGGEDF